MTLGGLDNCCMPGEGNGSLPRGLCVSHIWADCLETRTVFCNYADKECRSTFMLL